MLKKLLNKLTKHKTNIEAVKSQQTNEVMKFVINIRDIINGHKDEQRILNSSLP